MTIEIDRLSPDDRGAWEDLFRGYNEFYARQLTAEMADRAWSAFELDSVMHALGARLDGRLVGITHFLQHASTTSANVCYLQDLFTAPDARRRGVGGALIGAVARWAREQGCARVYWVTHEANARARRLYDQLAANGGFIRYELDL